VIGFDASIDTFHTAAGPATWTLAGTTDASTAFVNAAALRIVITTFLAAIPVRSTEAMEGVRAAFVAEPLETGNSAIRRSSAVGHCPALDTSSTLAERSVRTRPATLGICAAVVADLARARATDASGTGRAIRRNGLPTFTALACRNPALSRRSRAVGRLFALATIIGRGARRYAVRAAGSIATDRVAGSVRLTREPGVFTAVADTRLGLASLRGAVTRFATDPGRAFIRAAGLAAVATKTVARFEFALTRFARLTVLAAEIEAGVGSTRLALATTRACACAGRRRSGAFAARTGIRRRGGRWLGAKPSAITHQAIATSPISFWRLTSPGTILFVFAPRFPFALAFTTFAALRFTRQAILAVSLAATIGFTLSLLSIVTPVVF
jgi:hypothetical protein